MSLHNHRVRCDELDVECAYLAQESRRRTAALTAKKAKNVSLTDEVEAMRQKLLGKQALGGGGEGSSGPAGSSGSRTPALSRASSTPTPSEDGSLAPAAVAAEEEAKLGSDGDGSDTESAGAGVPPATTTDFMAPAPTRAPMNKSVSMRRRAGEGGSPATRRPSR